MKNSILISPLTKLNFFALTFLVILLSVNFLSAQNQRTPCSFLKSKYDDRVQVNGMVLDTMDCRCPLCEIFPIKSVSYMLKGVRYCRNGQLGYGKLDDKKDENNGKCVVFESSNLISYRNDFFLTPGVSSVFTLNGKNFQSNLLASLQIGYYIRNRLPKLEKTNQFHLSYSINAKHGLLMNYLSQTQPSYSPFLGVDLGINLFVRKLNGFISYSAGCSLLPAKSVGQLYYSIGYNYLLL